jgi:ferric-dicitrate binding protein FerR (iron transport regulator)
MNNDFLTANRISIVMDKELLFKYIKGDCTDQEKEDITNWLDSDQANMNEYLALRKLHDITIWQTPTITGYEQNSKGKNLLRSLRPLYKEVIKIAAILLAAVVISHFLFPVSTAENKVVMQTLIVPAGQRAEITLVDGTKVWLNAKTVLTFPNQFTGDKREVRLNGEGFFDVASGKSNPFIVKTEKYDIKVWGTKFNLMAYSGHGIFETSLLEGSVEVLVPGSPKGIMIRPDERIFLKDNHLVVSPINHLNHFLWKEGIISFEDESFPDLVEKLELYFDMKIEVKNDKILDYRCTGKFRTKDGLEHILKVLKLSNKFRYTINDKLNLVIIE